MGLFNRKLSQEHWPKLLKKFIKYLRFNIIIIAGMRDSQICLYMKYPKELSLDNYDNVTDLIVKFKRAFTMDQSSLLTMLEQDLKDTGTCRLSLAKKPWGVSKNAFALRKSSPFTQIFNHE